MPIGPDEHPSQGDEVYEAPRGRMGSKEAGGRTGSKELVGRMGSKESVASAGDGAVVRSNSVTRPGSATVARKSRDLAPQEIVHRDKAAVEWFRATRAINRRSRTLEDCDTLIAKARERRLDADGNSRAASKESVPPPGWSKQLSEPEKPQAPEKPEKPAEKGPRKLDMAAMWSAKKPEKEEPKPIPALQRCGSVICEGVHVGEGGENSLLNRLKASKLRRRNTVC